MFFNICYNVLIFKGYVRKVGLYVDYSRNAVGHMHIVQLAYASNVEFMHVRGHLHIVHCIEFI